MSQYLPSSCELRRYEAFLPTFVLLNASLCCKWQKKNSQQQSETVCFHTGTMPTSLYPTGAIFMCFGFWFWFFFKTFWAFIDRTDGDMTGKQHAPKGPRLGLCSEDTASVYGTATLPTELNGALMFFCSKRRRIDDYSFQLCDRVPGSRRHIAVLHGAAFADQDTSEGNNEVKLILSLRLKQVSGIPSYIRLQTL